MSFFPPFFGIGKTGQNMSVMLYTSLEEKNYVFKTEGFRLNVRE